MLPIVWLSSAEEDLERIITYIAEVNPLAARKLKNRLEDVFASPFRTPLPSSTKR